MPKKSRFSTTGYGTSSKPEESEDKEEPEEKEEDLHTMLSRCLEASMEEYLSFKLLKLELDT